MNIHSDILNNTAVNGSFICDASNPFDIVNHPGKRTFIVQFTSKDGEAPSLSSIVSGNITNASSLIGDVRPGYTLVGDVSSFSMGSGIGIVVLKNN